MPRIDFCGRYRSKICRILKTNTSNVLKKRTQKPHRRGYGSSVRRRLLRRSLRSTDFIVLRVVQISTVNAEPSNTPYRPNALTDPIHPPDLDAHAGHPHALREPRGG